MTDKEKQNTYGDPQYCSECGNLLEKARVKGYGICDKCKKEKVQKYNLKKKNKMIKEDYIEENEDGGGLIEEDDDEVVLPEDE